MRWWLHVFSWLQGQRASKSRPTCCSWWPHEAHGRNQESGRQSDDSWDDRRLSSYHRPHNISYPDVLPRRQTDDGAIEEPLKSKVEKQLLHRFHPTIFPMAINAIYRSTPASDRGLRDMIITITTHNIRELRQIEPQIPFSEILSENLQFSSDLCLAFMDLYTPELGCTLWNRIRFTRTMIPNQPEEQPDFNGDV